MPKTFAQPEERSMTERREVRLLGISGSIREKSNSTAILQTLAERLGATATMTLCPLGDIPLYNSDEDGDRCPSSVVQLKDAITNADGLVLCSPEYNHGTSGVLKNALDWASRPAFKSPLKDKPVLIMTSSPGLIGGVRAHQQLRDTLASALARVMAGQQVVVSNVLQKVVDGHLTDESTITFALGAIAELVREVRLLRSAEVD
jgi:chromate reductase